MTNDGPLDRLCGPTDLRALSVGQLSALAAEIRRLLIAEVSRRGGHLGPQPRRG
jgi:1-deoxy-D-xylulose-5-phosphate synthase